MFAVPSREELKKALWLALDDRMETYGYAIPLYEQEELDNVDGGKSSVDFIYGYKMLICFKSVIRFQQEANGQVALIRNDIPFSPPSISDAGDDLFLDVQLTPTASRPITKSELRKLEEVLEMIVKSANAARSGLITDVSGVGLSAIKGK